MTAYRVWTYGSAVSAVLGLVAYAADGSIQLGLIGIGFTFLFVISWVGAPMDGDYASVSDLRLAQDEGHKPSKGPAPPGPE